ncbi:Gti1/Pac2 family-domain-containing protein [Cytidiella melzeri]|nr:Gti1/Pac2 family-domain-containing protein [Cytidiella melzeri]
MQQQTLVNVHVSSTRDALQIFYAVARRVLPMITRCLDAEERRAIGPGNVYIWEERCANAEVTGLGMETDGISWSTSRIAQEFLFYRQQDTDPESSHPRSEVDRLIKQTFSVSGLLRHVQKNDVTLTLKTAAYFSQATLDSLNTIDMIPGVGDVSVPPGWLKNARASKGRAGKRPRKESPPSWPESWTGVEVPTDPFRPQYSLDGPVLGMHEEKHPWVAPHARISPNCPTNISSYV